MRIFEGRNRRTSPTSNRAFNKVNGLSRNPTATRALAPARRFPPLVSLGRTDEFKPRLDCWVTGAKYGDVAMRVRSCVKLVRYNATPGTFLQNTVNGRVSEQLGAIVYLTSEAVVPRQRPVQPLVVMTSRVVRKITVLLEYPVITRDTNEKRWKRLPCSYCAITLLHSGLQKINCSMY